MADNSLTKNDFGRLLISSFAKIQAAQEIQANMLASIIAGSNPEKHGKVMSLYFEDVDKAASQIYQNISDFLNSQTEND